MQFTCDARHVYVHEGWCHLEFGNLRHQFFVAMVPISLDLYSYYITMVSIDNFVWFVQLLTTLLWSVLPIAFDLYSHHFVQERWGKGNKNRSCSNMYYLIDFQTYSIILVQNSDNYTQGLMYGEQLVILISRAVTQWPPLIWFNFNSSMDK